MQPGVNRESEWCILLWCLAAQTVAARHLLNCWRLLLSSLPRVRKSTELLRHMTPDFTPDVASLQTRSQLCRLQIIESHPGMRLSETAGNIKHRCLLTEWHFINRLTHHISQGRVVTPIKFTSVSVCQTLSQYNAVWQSYCKNRRVQFFLPHSVEWCGYLKVKKVWGHV